MPKRGRGRGKADRRAEMTPEDCYLDVKDFWLRLSSQERSSLLRVPIRQLILGTLLAANSTFLYTHVHAAAHAHVLPSTTAPAAGYKAI